MFTWKTASRPIVALAPMAGVTDTSYRQFLKTIAPTIVVWSEFLSTDAIHYGAEKTLKMMEFDPKLENPYIVQVFGNDREHFISACKVIEQIGASGIDINMGCPAARVVSSCHGSALIRRVDLAMSVVDAAASAVSIPVSVKTRLGWDTDETLIPFCEQLIEAGAQCLSIHGRTYKQKFTGEANWDPIYELKKVVQVPVIGNGDIATAQDALEKLGNLDGVMVGRGTIGNPWLMHDICRAFASNNAAESALSMEEKIPLIIKHCELAVQHKGERRGVLEMRKHFAGYLRGFDGAKEVRMKLMQTEKLDDVAHILSGVTNS